MVRRQGESNAVGRGSRLAQRPMLQNFEGTEHEEVLRWVMEALGDEQRSLEAFGGAGSCS